MPISKGRLTLKTKMKINDANEFSFLREKGGKTLILFFDNCVSKISLKC